MARVVRRSFLGSLAVAAVVLSGWTFAGDTPVTAQSAPTPLVTIQWFGPFATTQFDTARFNYTNSGKAPVRIVWAFTNALSGEQICSNFGKPTLIEPGKGAIWDFMQRFDEKGNEIANCGEGPVEPEPGETYFDRQGRHQMIAWIFIQHMSQDALRQAVDLASLEIFERVDDPVSMTPGRTLQTILKNPAAPADYMFANLSSSFFETR